MRKIKGTINFILLALWSITASAVLESELLPADEAFAVSAQWGDQSQEQAQISWRVADGYYMYRQRISFVSKTDGVTLGDPIMPKGKVKNDEFFGEVETYRQQVPVSLPISVNDPSVSVIEIEARSQGCADVGVCYPPQRQIVTLERTVAASNTTSATPGLGNTLGLGQSSDPGFSPGFSLGSQALPAEQAFVYEAIAFSATEILARWTIQPGYYLYRDKINFEIFGDQSTQIESFDLPRGEEKVDEHFGNVEVYYDQIEVPIKIRRTDAAASMLQLTANYQGCKEAGICYPPQELAVAIALPQAPASALSATGAEVEPNAKVTQTQNINNAASTVPVGEAEQLANSLSSKSLWSLLLLYGLGLLLAFTPCVFPMIPILSGIIAGEGDSLTTRRAFKLSLVYVLAMAVTYTIVGVIAATLNFNTQAAFQNAWVLGVFSLIFVLLALSMFGFYELQLPSSWQTKLNNISNKQSGGSLIGVAIMGFLSALIVGPCVAPPLVGILIYISQANDPVYGGLALFALAMGMGTPLLAIGTSAGKFLPNAGAWMDAVKAFFGVMLLAVAIWLLERVLDPALIMLMWGILAISSSIYMGALTALSQDASGWKKLNKALALVLLILGTTQLIGAASGGNDWMRPLKGLGGGSAQVAQQLEFKKVKSYADLKSLLAQNGKPAMLDFYADWCTDCKRMDKYTFPEAPVQSALKTGIAVKADVTDNDAIDRELMTQFDIIGPPAILFFDKNGQELRAYRVVGYQKPEKFAKHIKAAFEAGS